MFANLYFGIIGMEKCDFNISFSEKVTTVNWKKKRKKCSDIKSVVLSGLKC